MNDILTAEALAEIEARANAATPGPIEALYVEPSAPAAVCNFGIVSRSTGRETARVWERGDVEFYAAAHTDIPALLASHKAQAAEIERLTKERDEARVALSAVKPNQWRTMESAPKDGTLILLGAQNTCESWVAEGYYELSTKRWIAANRYWSDDADWTFHPSHWMPLPQPPEGE